MTMKPTRPDSGGATAFLIVDDHADFRHQGRALLEAEGLRVVGEAGDGRSALIRSTNPQERLTKEV
jgi:DNA-binding NarL/FixJ family response regulator